MYHSETNTFCNVLKSKISITDLYELIRHMHECRVNIISNSLFFIAITKWNTNYITTKLDFVDLGVIAKHVSRKFLTFTFTLCMLGNFHDFFLSFTDFFFKILDPNCLQMLSAGNISKQRYKVLKCGFRKGESDYCSICI